MCISINWPEWRALTEEATLRAQSEIGGKKAGPKMLIYSRMVHTTGESLYGFDNLFMAR